MTILPDVDAAAATDSSSAPRRDSSPTVSTSASGGKIWRRVGLNCSSSLKDLIRHPPVRILQQPRREGEDLRDGSVRQGRVRLVDLLLVHALREAAQHERHRDAGSFDAQRAGKGVPGRDDADVGNGLHGPSVAYRAADAEAQQARSRRTFPGSAPGQSQRRLPSVRPVPPPSRKSPDGTTATLQRCYGANATYTKMIVPCRVQAA